MLIYENIKHITKQRKLTINEVERAADLGRGSISKWNKVSPSIQNIIKVAKVLGCTVDDLIRDEGTADESAMLTAS